MSWRTVEPHVANVYAKIGTRGRANATAYALTHGLIQPPTSKPYAFTDITGAAASRFPAQKWVVTPMAHTSPHARLFRGVSKCLKGSIR
jgi:hypothetical protein